MTIIDAHIHCGIQDHSDRQAYEDVAPFLTAVDATAAVCFAPVAEIYDRTDPNFEDTPAWRQRRRRAHEYLAGLKGLDHTIYPFWFVWNDFDPSGLDRFCGVKWHRHPEEPRYRYGDPRCGALLQRIRERDLPVLLEEEFANTVRFVREWAPGVRVIIPHLGLLNGGFDALERAGIWAEPLVYADTALAPAATIARYLERYGPERLIFGSDYPFGDTVQAHRTLQRVGMGQADQALVLGGNIRRLLRNTGGYERREKS